MPRPRKIAYVSGSRADFGLMSPVLRAISDDRRLSLQVYYTGMHLMSEFGHTAEQVLKEFPNAKKLEATFVGNEKSATATFTAKLTDRLVTAFENNRPNFVLTLGDRPEMLSVAVTCLYLGVPTGQLHGGEKTGTVDEIARHAITKLSHLHLPATKESAKRIETMGEEKWRIRVVGAPAMDIILHKQLLNHEQLCKRTGINPKQKIVLITQHPVSGEEKSAGRQMRETLEAAKRLRLPAVVIYPNADPGSQKIINVIKTEKRNPLFHIYPNLPYQTFLAFIKEAAIWLGNSSAGLIESAAFQTPVVNIGTRQIGRQRSGNVIDATYDRNDIYQTAMNCLYHKSFIKRFRRRANPWGDGRTGSRVAEILANLKIDAKLLNKQITY